jgi:ribulose-phosphate 3-epimerase
MSVDPGYSFQTFMDFAVEKVRELRRLAGPGLEILVDGGVIPDEVAGRLARAGASTFVAGASTFGSDDMCASVAALKSPPLGPPSAG